MRNRIDKIFLSVWGLFMPLYALGDDYGTFYEKFIDPPKEYRPAPLYVWNTQVTAELINHTMEDLHEQGFGGVFVHPRPGLKNEYLSDEWFSLFQHTLNTGKKLGMNVWVYDENTFPSGFAGGHVNAEMPESYNQGGSIVLYQYNKLPENIDNLYLILKEEAGNYVDVTANFLSERKKNGKYYVYVKSFEPRVAWHGGYSYVDLLYPGVTQKFLEVTGKGYEKVASKDFGKYLPGWFTDEPHVGPPGGGIRWTPDLFDTFYKRWKYDLKSYLPSLSLDVGPWKQVRHDYYQTLLDLFIERWAKPYYEYCSERGLALTGHYWEHAWPEITYGPDNMAMYAWQHVPGIDMLMNQFDEDEPQAQFGNVRSVKEVRSVANQLGRERILCETYGASGWEERFEDFKRLGDWQTVLGVNFMNQHLSHLSLAGDRKYDCPPSFSEHSPWWRHYKNLNDHFSRLSVAMSVGEQINDILVIEPTTTIWMYYVTWASRPQLWNIGRSFQRFVTTLEKSQSEYDLGSEQVISDYGSICNHRFKVGQREYSTVVIPPLTENLNKRTFDLLKEFAKVGGKILAFAIPTLVDGCENREIVSFFQKNKSVIREKELTQEVVDKYLLPKDFRIVSNQGGNLFHHRRKMSDGEVVLLVNSDLNESSKGMVQLAGAGVVELNTFSGKVVDYPNSRSSENVKFDYELSPGGHLLVYVFEKKHHSYQSSPVTTQREYIMPVSPLKINPLADNVLVVDFCDLELADSVHKDIHIYEADQKVFKHFGFPEGNPWGTAIQYKKNIVERDINKHEGFKLIYHFQFDNLFNVSTADWKIVIERSNLYSIAINGIKVSNQTNEWWLDRDFCVLPLGKYICNGVNSLTLSIDSMNLDAEPAPIYVLGDFKLLSAEHGWKMVGLNNKIELGSWRVQGSPFYADAVTYEQSFQVPYCENMGYEVQLGKWNGTVSEELVNGVSAGIIAFKPYTLDVSKLIRPGINQISVKVVGSNKNLFGPFHNESSIGFVTPNLYKGTVNYPAGKDYMQFDYGLYEPFLLLSKSK